MFWRYFTFSVLVAKYSRSLNSPPFPMILGLFKTTSYIVTNNQHHPYFFYPYFCPIDCYFSFIKWLFLYLELSGWLGKKLDLASNEKSGQLGKKSDLASNEIRLTSNEMGPY